MTAGPFIMTNLEGLFSPFRDLESEMDELRTMRRVSQIWHEMEQREQGAWMMFGRFFDRQIDEMNRMTSLPWESSLFSRSRSDRQDHTFGTTNNFVSKPDNNVIVEFPDEQEIKITLEEPSVVITEVEDSPEPTVASASPTLSSDRNSSPVRQSPFDESSAASDPEMKTYISPSVSKSSTEEQIVRSVNSFGKTEKLEKRLKKVDFSKMEVHFELGSGKVNIIETNEKPPSNQLFRRKKRHRDRIARSESPKVSSADNESFENISPDSKIKESVDENILNSNKNNLNLSIFNLRNTLFKNSANSYIGTKSKNVLTNPFDNGISSKMSNIGNTVRGKEKVLSNKNISTNYSSYTKTSFNLSSKLQNMIQNSVKNKINFARSDTCEIEENSFDKWEKQPDNEEIYTLENAFKNHSLQQNKYQENKISDEVKSNVSLDQLIYPNKQLANDNKKINKTKNINKVDSFKKNAKVARQESLRSTSSRGSISSENKHSQKRNSLKDSLRKDSFNGRVNRTPSIGKITTSSLKKGGIYVDGRPKKSGGATITLISYSTGTANSKSNESTANNNSTNNITINNLNNVRKKPSRRDSLKSSCSKESLASVTNKFAQKKKIDLKDNAQENMGKISGATSYVGITNSASSKLNLNGLDSLNYKIKTTVSSINPRSPIFNNTTNKLSSFNYRSSGNRFESGTTNIIKTKANPSVDGQLSKENINCSKDLTNIRKFHHENSSLFQPIKKEKSIHSSKIQLNEIKTPVPLRKKSNSIGSDSNSSKKDIAVTNYVSTRSSNKKNITGSRGENLHILNTPTSKLSLTSLRRSKEPLRSFEKISNGWVGQCNIASVNQNSKSESKWATKRVSDTRLTNLVSSSSERSKIINRNLVSPLQTNLAPRITEHQQRESMLRLSQGYSSRKLSSPSSLLFTKQTIETRKRSRNVNTPSSISSQSSNIPVMTKRRSTLVSKNESPRIRSSRSDTPTPSEPIYETLNSRRKTPTLVVRRSRQTNPCCNI